MPQTPPSSFEAAPTSFFTFGEPPRTMALENGGQLGPVTLAYETYGTLNAARSNAILAPHAFTGDAHAAGFHPGDEKPGWWDNMIGPGKAFDTDQYFVICSNVLGGCKGSTGPASTDPATGMPYGLRFPAITMRDMVDAQQRLVRSLGIERLLAVAGGSMGGMQVLQWVVSYPEMVAAVIPIATTLRHNPQQIAFNEVGRQAIMADPAWNRGEYYGTALPVKGLSVARMVGHITYMSDESMREKFGRRMKNLRAPTPFAPGFEVEGYLQHRGDSFVKRFDANSYLYLSKAMDEYDLIGDRRLGEIFGGVRAAFMVIAFKSDWLYPAYQSQEIVKACKISGLDVTYCEIESTYGHDAFLLETEQETHLIGHFLKRMTESLGKN
jgi:homoserine O-acetyltransferase